MSLDRQFLVYSHAIHPEFFTRLQVRSVEVPGFRIEASITPSGHTFLWTDGESTLFEVLWAGTVPWSDHGCLVRSAFENGQRAKVELDSGVRYEMSLAQEVVVPEVFEHLHAEMLEDGRKRGLLFHHAPGPLSPLSYITADHLPKAIAINAFHTDPKTLTILKTQSLIDVRGI
ncbi:MAG: DUF2617 family protein [Fimbriiglobus sp.]